MASTHLASVASLIRKAADPAHMLVICGHKLIDRSLMMIARGELPDPLPISQKLD